MAIHRLVDLNKSMRRVFPGGCLVGGGCDGGFCGRRTGCTCLSEPMGRSVKVHTPGSCFSLTLGRYRAGRTRYKSVVSTSFLGMGLTTGYVPRGVYSLSDSLCPRFLRRQHLLVTRGVHDCCRDLWLTGPVCLYVVCSRCKNGLVTCPGIPSGWFTCFVS